MKKDDTVYLRHVLDAIEQIEDYLKGVSPEEFMQKRLLQDGVVCQLEIIGEASRNLSDGLRQRHSEVPWGPNYRFKEQDHSWLLQCKSSDRLGDHPE